MSLFLIQIIALTLCSGVQVALWWHSSKGARAAWADIGWAVSIALCAVWFFTVTEGAFERKILLLLMPLAWSIRLVWHLYHDRIRHGHNDGRYDALKASWKNNASTKFFIFFQMQAILAYVLSVPFFLGMQLSYGQHTVQTVSAILLFCTAILGQTIADAQLRRFKQRDTNKKQVCEEGLWYYSRHPNYFFEWLHWMVYVVILLDTWIAIPSALVASIMLGLVLFVTGIPPTEAQSLRSRGDAYRVYQETTSAFVPWFKKRTL